MYFFQINSVRGFVNDSIICNNSVCIVLFVLVTFYTTVTSTVGIIFIDLLYREWLFEQYLASSIIADERRDNLPLRQGPIAHWTRDRYERRTTGQNEAAPCPHPVTQVAVLRQRARNTLHLPGRRHVRRHQLRSANQARSFKRSFLPVSVFLFFVLILFYFTASFTFGYMRMARKVKAAWLTTQILRLSDISNSNSKGSYVRPLL